MHTVTAHDHRGSQKQGEKRLTWERRAGFAPPGRSARMARLSGCHHGRTAVLLLGLLVLILSASCRGGEGPLAPATRPSQAPITLHVFHWLGSDIGPVVAEIDRRFIAENPGIKIESESFQLDRYEQALERRLAAGDPLDIVAVGEIRPLEVRIKPGDLLDLSAEPWVKQLTPEALREVSDGAKVYALPLGKAAIGVAYNKDIFARLGIGMPATWPEFVAACRAIKAAGIVPLALANDDPWLIQLMPRAMAATAVYGQDPDFDTRLVRRESSVSASPWRQLIADQLSLQAGGCFGGASPPVSYDQSIELVATGRAAMALNGTWIVPQIKGGNPALQLGMFPLPYATAGQQVQVPTIITPLMAVPASTRYPVEAKKYLEFLARPDVMPLILRARGELPVMSGIVVTQDPALDGLLSQAKTGSRDVFARSWPLAAREQFFYGLQGVLTGRTALDAFLEQIDKAFEAG
jgi:raffinose/stachyose/melibiose transport system substrate-binding protein